MKRLFLRKSQLCFTHSILIVVVLVLLVIGGCGMVEMTSHWASRPIDIASTNTELQEALVPLEERPVLLAIMNDSNYLYLTLVTSDRSIQRQIMFRGFTVWLDRTGGNDKTFGIKFPLGMQMGDFRQMREEMNRDNDRDRDRDDNERMRFPPIDTTEIEILGPKEDDHQRVKVIALKQIGVKFTVADGRMQYTMRIPLTDNGPDPYAIGTKPGAIIGVGLETAKMERRPPAGDDNAGGLAGGGFGGAGEGGGGGMRPGGEGGMPPGGGRPGGMQQSESLKFWAKVHLAGGGL